MKEDKKLKEVQDKLNKILKEEGYKLKAMTTIFDGTILQEIKLIKDGQIIVPKK